MAEILDYETPPPRPKQSFGILTWALILSLLEHMFVFGIYAATLDGGARARQCGAVSLGYWAVVGIILFRLRRSARPSKVDVAFVAAGYPAMLVICALAGALD